MVGRSSKGANPPFGSGQMGRMYGEGLVIGVLRGRCLQAFHFGSMPELRLCVAPNVFISISFSQERFVLHWYPLISPGYLRSSFDSVPETC